MSTKTDNFIKTVAALARNEYMSRDKWILPSICIAQAALESGWNLNASTLFGIKGGGFVATTSEYYNGHYEQIQASFRDYPSVAAAVVGYYDFLRDTPRYCKALCNADYKDAVDKLIHTTDGAPYATDPGYIGKIISIIEDYNLTKYDARETAAKTVDELAEEVIAGAWGNGAERQQRLEAAGYSYVDVQAAVNAKMEPEAPSEDVYTVQPGDTLWGIARQYGTTVAALANHNDIANPSLIYAGQEIRIPN